MRGTGYLGPLVIDAGGSGQDYAGIVANAQAIQNSDPQQNCVFSYHGYGSATNNECVITSATKANPCVLTLDSSAAYHPFLPQYPSFTSNNFGHNNFFVSGALGMTQLNGAQASSNNNAGGSSGSWTVKLSADSTAWGTYTANSARLVYAQDYRQIIASLAALRTNNVCAMCLEFGPGNGMGSRAISFTGYISGTTLTVVSMLTEGAILPYNIAAFGVGTVLTGNSSAPVSNGTTVLSQSSGATGGAGVYVINNSQTVGSAGSPVPMYIQEAGGSSTSWQGLGIDGSPTDTSLAQIICACEANLVPWNYWASDDHDQGTNQECSWAGGWFGIVNELGGWAVPSDLTSNGMDVVFNPCYGLRTLAQPPSSYA
jgi:hypothetical protein